MIYIVLFLTFLKIGAFTFGGGYAMIPLIQQEVLRYGWLTPEEVLDFIAISESTPGPLAVNMATFVGSRTGGILGAFCATFGVVLPSFLIILLIVKVLEKFQKSLFVKGAMLGLKGAVVGLIGSAVISTTNTVIHQMGNVVGESFRESQFRGRIIVEWGVGGILFLGCFIALKKKLHPIVVLVVSAIVGILVREILL